MMLAFLIVQTKPLTSALFLRGVWRKLGTKRALWENVRNLVDRFRLESMEMLCTALLNGDRKLEPEILHADP